jgi:transitional endoplasmic reticulum ATPase
MAELLARSLGLPLFRMSPTDLMPLGHGDQAADEILRQALASLPAALFIDEIDLVGKCRGKTANARTDGALTNLLALLEKVEKTDRLFVIAATNRADLLDPAVRRPGRLTKVITVALPTSTERGAILELCFAKLRLELALDLPLVVELTDGLSGAALEAICKEAARRAVSESEGALPPITLEHMLPALEAHYGTSGEWDTPEGQPVLKERRPRTRRG